jgi:hypothetical protein
MNNIQNFESYFSNTLRKDHNIRFTILLGSGFHRLDNGNTSVLNNWDFLLKSISPNFKVSGNYLLDFEKIILEKVSDSNAQKQEDLLLKSIANVVKNAELLAIENEINNYPSFIFNPNYVSDVISLNFDCLAEKLCKLIFKAKLIKSGYVEIDKKFGKDALLHQTTKYRILKFPCGKTITFWYPHGSVCKSSGILLGARKYGRHISCIERLRIHSKAVVRKNQKKDTWYDKLTHNPLIIIGASISSNEWDIWSAFVNRERNFYKNINNGYRKPIFQMRSNQYKKVSDDNNNEQWFEPLFDENLDFNNQWEKLIELFKKSKK